jgi:hypothetical protein
MPASTGVALGVGGTGVSVGVRVRVGLGVAVLVGVDVAVLVGAGVGVLAGVGVGVLVGADVAVPVGVDVAVFADIGAGVGMGVAWHATKLSTNSVPASNIRTCLYIGLAPFSEAHVTAMAKRHTVESLLRNTAQMKVNARRVIRSIDGHLGSQSWICYITVVF